ncbi:MAG: hypothetical protein OEL53_13490 [Rhodospirillales bacterium]|nr:hypothetical protein [Rhodospirillales bacterium]
MISSIESAGRQITDQGSLKDFSKEDGFDAALQAASKAEARASARQSEVQAIREKGFRQWVGEMQIEKLKEELRKKIMAAMGVSEEDLAQMAPAVQLILERKIQEAVENQLEEELGRQQASPAGQPEQIEAANGGQTVQEAEAALPLARQNAPDQKDERGKTCPVIPALAWPGLAPGALF